MLLFVFVLAVYPFVLMFWILRLHLHISLSLSRCDGHTYNYCRECTNPPNTKQLLLMRITLRLTKNSSIIISQAAWPSTGVKQPRNTATYLSCRHQKKHNIDTTTTFSQTSTFSAIYCCNYPVSTFDHNPSWYPLFFILCSWDNTQLYLFWKV